MIYKNLELYNVQELLEGDGMAVLPAEARQRMATDPASDAAWHGENAEGLWLSRLPDELRRKLNPAAQHNTLQATGCEARFNLSGDSSVTMRLKCMFPAVVEVYQGCFMTGWQVVGPEGVDVVAKLPGNLAELERLTAEHKLPFDARLTRIVLPWRPPARILDLQGECTPPRPGQTPALRYLAYGSSITHGALAVRPTGCYAARTAQLLGADLINLGFGGGAHLEAELGDYIAARDDWDVASLEMGINIGDIGVEEFTRRVDRFVGAIARAAENRKGLLCTDVFTCREDLIEHKWARGYRQAVREKVASLNSPKVAYVAGDELLTLPQGLTADLVHPSPEGMEQIARNLLTALSRLLA